MRRRMSLSVAIPYSGSTRRKIAFRFRVSTIKPAIAPSAAERSAAGRSHHRSTRAIQPQIKKKEDAWLNVASNVP